MQKLTTLHQAIIEKTSQIPLIGELLSSLAGKLKGDAKKLPKALISVFSKLPQPAQIHFIELILATVFSEQIASDELDFLIGKRLAVAFSDVPFRFYLTMLTAKNSDPGSKKIQVTTHLAHSPEVTFAGDVNSFLTLLTRKQDPDTLFFKRKLIITGDTELGLLIKNFLDDVSF